MNSFKEFFKELDSRSQQVHFIGLGKKLHIWAKAITYGVDQIKGDDRIYLDAPLTLDEVDVFLEYVSQQEALLPLTDPTAYMHGGQKTLEQARERAKGFRALLLKLKEKL